MRTESLLKLSIDRSHVLDVLLNKQENTPESIAKWVYRSEIHDEIIIECEGMNMATIVSLEDYTWKTTRIACMHYSHGIHEKFRTVLSDEQRRRVNAATKGMVDSHECDLCDHGWYWIDSFDAKKQIEMIKQFGVFRGVCIGQISSDSLRKTDSNDMVVMFLSGISQIPEYQSPPGCQPGRAFFKSKEKM